MDLDFKTIFGVFLHWTSLGYGLEEHKRIVSIDKIRKNVRDWGEENGKEWSPEQVTTLAEGFQNFISNKGYDEEALFQIYQATNAKRQSTQATSDKEEPESDASDEEKQASDEETSDEEEQRLPKRRRVRRRRTIESDASDEDPHVAGPRRGDDDNDEDTKSKSKKAMKEDLHVLPSLQKISKEIMLTILDHNKVNDDERRKITKDFEKRLVGIKVDTFSTTKIDTFSTTKVNHEKPMEIIDDDEDDDDIIIIDDTGMPELSKLEEEFHKDEEESEDEILQDVQRVEEELIAMTRDRKYHEQNKTMTQCITTIIEDKATCLEKKLLNEFIQGIKKLSEDYDYEDIIGNLVWKGTAAWRKRCSTVEMRAVRTILATQKLPEVLQDLNTKAIRFLREYEQRLGGPRNGRMARARHYVNRLVIRYAYDRYFETQFQRFRKANQSIFTKPPSEWSKETWDRQYEPKQFPYFTNAKVQRTNKKCANGTVMKKADEGMNDVVSDNINRIQTITFQNLLYETTPKQAKEREEMMPPERKPEVIIDCDTGREKTLQSYPLAKTVQSAYQEMLYKYLMFYWRDPIWKDIWDPSRQKKVRTCIDAETQLWFNPTVETWVIHFLQTNPQRNVENFLKEFNIHFYRCLTEHNDGQGVCTVLPLLFRTRAGEHKYYTTNDDDEKSDLMRDVVDALRERYIQNCDRMANQLIEFTEEDIVKIMGPSKEFTECNQLWEQFNTRSGVKKEPQSDPTPGSMVQSDPSSVSMARLFTDMGKRKDFQQHEIARGRRKPDYKRLVEEYKAMNNESMKRVDPNSVWEEKEVRKMLSKNKPIDTSNEPNPEYTYDALGMADESVREYALTLYPMWPQNRSLTWAEVKTRLEPSLEKTYDQMTSEQQTYCRGRLQLDLHKNYEKERNLPWGEIQVRDKTTYNELETKRSSLKILQFLSRKYDKWHQTPDMTLAEMRLLSNLPSTLTYPQLFSDPRYSEKISQILYNQYPTWPDTPHKTLKQMREEAPLRGAARREEAPPRGLVRTYATIRYQPDDDS